MDTLKSRLAYEPRPLRFGTSGRRGEVIHLSHLEIYINALAELGYLQSLPRSEGGILSGEPVYVGYDLRPSSTCVVPEQGGRGEIVRAILRAISDAGMQPVSLGCVPTPALTYYALKRGKASIMVTGSHIPFDRNGYKLNTSRGELLKCHEGPIDRAVAQVRETIYGHFYEASLFDANGMFKTAHSALPAENAEAKSEYLGRYVGFFGGLSLRGKRILVYQHSAVGRDLLVTLLEHFGAEVIAAGRSDSFVPIDTENIDAEQLRVIQSLVDQAFAKHGSIDAVVSTDGDSDRPLILGVDPATQKVKFFNGDLVGMIACEYLNADAAVVPISCNDAIDRGSLAPIVEPKTRIGSPYVIEGIEQARAKGKKVICGWEANGGFLLGSDIERDGKVLKALPTRDAFLPILCTLFSAHVQRISLHELFAQLPERYARAALLKNFPRPTALRILEQYSPSDTAIQEIAFRDKETLFFNRDQRILPSSGESESEARSIKNELGRFFSTEIGFGGIHKLNYTDGVRITFSDGQIAHLRPSGNADEFRIYAVASSPARADEIVRLGVSEPNGILRKMETTIMSMQD
jgi:phosphomannomutase